MVLVPHYGSACGKFRVLLLGGPHFEEPLLSKGTDNELPIHDIPECFPEDGPLSAIALGSYISETGSPPKMINIVCGDGEQGTCWPGP